MVCGADKTKESKMKKLLTAMSAVVLAFGLNAATVDWKYSITNAQGTEGYNNGYTVYLVDATAWDGATISAATFSDASVVLDSTTFGAATGRNVGQKTYMTVGNSGARSVAISSLSDGSSLDVYYVILNTNADPNTYTTVADTLTGRADTGEAVFGSHTSMTAAAASAATWTAVPEPTSGLLLVLGVAGLALRRKRA